MAKRIDIKITYKCNNHCKFCVQGDKRTYCDDKTFHEVKEILDNGRKNYDEVVFTGGEPTIHPDIIAFVRYAKRLGYRVHIQSNGRMLQYKHFARDIAKAGVDVFTLSLHGNNAQLHDGLTEAQGGFEQTISAIKNLFSLRKIVCINTVITRKNYEVLPEVAKLLIGLGISEYRFSFPHILGRALKNREEIVPRKEDIIAYVRNGLEIGIKKKLRPMTEAIPYCFLQGYHECMVENWVPPTKVFDVYIIEEFNTWRKEKGKCKGPRCKECKYFSCCEGPWHEYPEFFGWDEFCPIQ